MEVSAFLALSNLKDGLLQLAVFNAQGLEMAGYAIGPARTTKRSRITLHVA